jgi:hypothetical protein
MADGQTVGKRVVQGVVVALCLVGLYGVYGAFVQAREDYSNFRKIVIWVYQKQAQEAEYLKRQAAQKPPVPQP